MMAVDDPELLAGEEDRPHLGDRPGDLRPPREDGDRLVDVLGVPMSREMGKSG